MKYYLVPDEADPQKIAVIGTSGFVPPNMICEAPKDEAGLHVLDPSCVQTVEVLDDAGNVHIHAEIIQRNKLEVDYLKERQRNLSLLESQEKPTLEQLMDYLAGDEDALAHAVEHRILMKQILSKEQEEMERVKTDGALAVLNNEGNPELARVQLDSVPKNFVGWAPPGVEEGDEIYLKIEGKNIQFDSKAKRAVVAKVAAGGPLTRLKKAYIG